MTEKSIERYYLAEDGMYEDPTGHWCRHEDHLEALGEAERELERYRSVFADLCWKCGGSGEIAGAFGDPSSGGLVVCPDCNGRGTKDSNFTHRGAAGAKEPTPKHVSREDVDESACRSREAESVETFVIDGRPLGPVWIDHGYRSGPRVKLAGSLGAIRFVPGAAYDEAWSRQRSAEQKLSELSRGLEAEVERLRKVEADCTREVERRRDQGRERNVLAEGRVMTAGATADRLQELLDQSETAGES